MNSLSTELEYNDVKSVIKDMCIQEKTFFLTLHLYKMPFGN